MRRAGYIQILIFALLFLAGVPGNVFAQLKQAQRFEIERKTSENNYNIISLGDQGLALIRDTEKYEEGKKIWEAVLLDTALQQQWEGKFYVENRLNLIGHEYMGGRLYLLFKLGENTSHNLQVLNFSIATHEYTVQEIKLQVDCRLTHFTVCESTVVLGGYVVREPAVFLFSTNDSQLKVVPGFFLKDTELLDLRTNHNNTFNVLMVERGNGREEKKMIVRTFDSAGAMLLEELIPVDNGKIIQAGLTSALVHDELIVVGTYGYGNGTRQASGIFSTIIDPFSVQPVYYSDLTQLQHFTDYLGNKRSSKVKQNAMTHRERGRPPMYKSEISLVKIHETKKGFLLLVESYSSSSSVNNNQYWSNYPYGSGMYQNPYGTFYPYGGRYYNAPYSYNNNTNQHSDIKMNAGALVLFGLDGKIDWDESFKTENLKIPSLEQATDFIEPAERFVLAYKKKSEIFTKVTVPHQDEVELDTLKLKPKLEGDIVRNEIEEDSGIRHWYNNNFYAWGYQTIRNENHQSEEPVRHVFYVNKITE